MPGISRMRAGALALAALLLAGCRDDDPSGAGEPARLEVVAAPAPSAVQGTTLPDSVAVRVLDQDADPVPGVQVEWTVVEGGGTVTPAQGTTDAAGIVRAAWTLGPAGPQRIHASTENLQVTLTTQSLPGITFFINADSVQVALGGRVRVDARQNDPFGNEQLVNVTWTSLDPRVAQTAPSPGAGSRATDIVGLQVGTTRVVASTGERSDTVVVRVLSGSQSGTLSWTRERGEAPLRGVTGVWASSATSVYLSADSGYVYRWDGQRWRRAPRIVTQQLNDVWGASATDVFAVGLRGTVLRGSGDSWTAMSTPLDSALNDVWGSSASDVWAVGTGGTILHYDGAAWTATPSGTTQTLNAVWGSGSTVFAVGNGGTILRRTGGAWETMASGTTQPLTGVWGTGPQQVYAMTDQGVLLRYDGVTWTQVYTPGQASPRYHALGGTGPTAVFRGGGDVQAAGRQAIITGYVWRFDGTGVTPAPELVIPGSLVHDIWGVDPTTAFAATSSGVWRYDGAQWTPMSGIAGTLRDVWAVDAENAFAVGDDGTQTLVLRRTAGGWQPMPRPSPAATLYAVTAVSATQVWVGASDGVYRWDGAAWTRVHVSNRAVLDVYAVAADQVYAVSEGEVWRGNGGTWTSIGATDSEFFLTSWRGVWASGPGDVWIVGSNKVARYNGSTWTTTQLLGFTRGIGMTATAAVAVYGTGPNDVYVVGNHVQRWNGTQWTQLGADEGISGEDVWASSPTDVFVAGRELYRFDGTRWTREGVDAAEGAFLRAVHGAGGHVYAVGDEQTVLHGTR